MYESRDDTAGVRWVRGLALLEQAADLLAEVDLTEVVAPGLGEQVLALITQGRRIAGVQAAAADRFSTSGAWAADAARHAPGWLAGRSNESVGAMRTLVRSGAGMRVHASMADAVRAGEVSLGHLRALMEVQETFPRLRTLLEQAGDLVVALARESCPRRFHEVLRAKCHEWDPTAVEKDERQRDAEAYLRVSPVGFAMFRVDGLLPAEIGMQFAAMLESARRSLATEVRRDLNDAQHSTADESSGHPDVESAHSGIRDHDPGAAVIGTDVLGNPIRAEEIPVGMGDARYTSGRNVDALRRILEAAASATDPDGSISLPAVNSSRPVIHVTVPIDSLLAESENNAAAWLERFGVPAAAISAAKAAHLTCDGVIEPLLVDKAGRLIATLPTTRAVPPLLRKAVLLRDQVCRINACRDRIDEVHHIVFASHGGPTSLDNLAGLCWFHHHLIHHGHWTLTGDANHALTLTNTVTGQEWVNHPPPPR